METFLVLCLVCLVAFVLGLFGFFGGYQRDFTWMATVVAIVFSVVAIGGETINQKPLMSPLIIVWLITFLIGHALSHNCKD